MTSVNTKKEEYKNKQFNRLKHLFLIYKCFEHYKTAILYSESAANINSDNEIVFNTTFEEDLSDLFGVEYNEENNLNADELCDEAIDEYNTYKNMASLLDDKTKDVIKSFCDYIISDNEYTFINGTGFLVMPSLLKDVMKWQKGKIHAEEIKMIYGGVRQLSFYRKEILRTERIINDLINFNKKDFAIK